MNDPRRELVVRRAMTIALRTSAAILGSREEAADVAQDVAIDVLRSIDDLREPDAFDAWVQRIAVRHTMRALRRTRDRPLQVPLALAMEVADLPEQGRDRDLVLAARGALTQALTQLPEKQRIAVALRYGRDLNDREIADAMGCRRGTVNSLLSRARATLRRSPDLQALVQAMETR